MQIERLSPDEYAKIYTPQHVFNSVGFTELNRDKAEDLHYLSIRDTKHRFGIILGERNGMLRSPFSAPFGGFTTRGVQNARCNLPLRYSQWSTTRRNCRNGRVCFRAR